MCWFVELLSVVPAASVFSCALILAHWFFSADNRLARATAVAEGLRSSIGARICSTVPSDEISIRILSVSSTTRASSTPRAL